MSAVVESVNTGVVRDVPWGRLKRSAIDKRPVTGPVAVGPRGLAGDEIGDTKYHGGADQAVYAYAREDLDHWSAELGRALPTGVLGENLTTAGLDVTGARIGDRWRVGTAVLEVAGVRTPCAVLSGFLAQPDMMSRFRAYGAPGAYLRVVLPGEVAAGDAVEVVERRDHDLTVGLAFRALQGERHLLPAFATEPRAGAKLRRKAEEAIRRGRDDSPVG